MTPQSKATKLPREFYLRPDVLTVSRDLLGKLLVVPGPNGERVSGKIVEVEAYRGPEDRASHAYGGRRTKRTETMYGAGGVAYVYFVYGMYYQFNVVSNVADVPHAILVRALEPVEGIETFEFQMNMFGKMPGAKPPADPEAAARTKAQVAAVLEKLQADWNRGDIEGFTPMLQQMEAGSPKTYKLLFNDRNNRWAYWIAKRLQQPGVVFVAVGAGHLAGKDSVQNKLSLYGIRTARVN